MSSTDDRIVRMQFENKQFMKAAADTQKSLADVNKAVDSSGKSKGLLDLSSQMNTVMATASKMQVVTVTALATIANKVVNTGLRMASALTMDPIRQGFGEYEALLTKQNVIMNATGKSATEVKGYLRDLNHYSDQTIYSFGDMTDSITKFVNAGVPLPQAVTSIKGIANAAAFAGANSTEAGRAMYAFSQSMQTGYIMLQDWMQIENANMGTQQFRKTLLESAVAVGTLTRQGEKYVTASGKVITSTEGWRDGLQEQWATTDVLNDALGKYADNTTELGKKAFDSATKVRTFTAFMDTLKESLGSGWAQLFGVLVGGLHSATSMWTGLSNAVAGSVQKFFWFLTVTAKTFKRMGGMENLLQTFKNILAPFAALLGAIGSAWNEAFPHPRHGAGKNLYLISVVLEAITRPLAWLAKGIPAITPLLVIFFRILGGGVGVVRDVIRWLSELVTTGTALTDLDAPKATGFLGFVQDIGRFLSYAVGRADDLLDRGKDLGSFFSGFSLPSLPSIPSMPDLSGASSGADKASAAASSTASGMARSMEILRAIAGKMGDAFSWMWDQATSFFSKASPEAFMHSFNQAIFATMAYEIIRFTHTLRKGFSSLAEIGPTFVDMMDNVGNSLTGFAKAAKREAMAKMILNVAIALGILAVSLWILSRIPADKLGIALGAMGAVFLMLNTTMKSFTGVVDAMATGGTIGKTLALSVAMLALAGSMILLATALLIMNKVDWTSLGKGLGSMIVMMKTLESLGNMGQYAARNLIAGGVAIGLTAAALIVLAGALLLFKLVDWTSMGKAGAALAGLTLAVGALALIPYQGIAKVGLAMTLAAAGLLVVANALMIFALVKWSSIGKAAVMLGALTLSLGILMAVGGPAGAASMLALSASLVALAAACLMLNHVDWESIGKAAVVLTLLLLAVAAAAVIMTAFLYAIAPVSPVLIILAAGFALLGVGLLAFAAAMAIAMSLAAAGTAAFAALATGAAVAIAVFLQTLASEAPIMKDSILKILQAIIDTIVESVPMVIKGFKDLFKAIAKEMSSGDKKQTFGEIVGGWLDKMIEVGKKYIPKFVDLGVQITLRFVQSLAKRADQFAQAGVDMVLGVLEGLGSRADKITGAATDLVIKLAQGLEKNAVKMVNAGIDLIATFLHDLADAIRNGSSKIGAGITDVLDAMKDVGVNMVKGLASGVTEQAKEALDAIGGLVNDMIGIAKKIPIINSPSRVFMDIGKFMVQGLTKGIQIHAATAITSVASMMRGSIAIADEYMNKMLQKLDQKAIEAQAKAEGLRKAAEKAEKSANRTKKDKSDDKAAAALSREAKKAERAARKEAKKAQAAKKAEERKKRWEEADSAERAEIRSNQAQSQLAAAKEAERSAEAARVQAKALEEQAKKAGSEKERKRLLAEAEKLRAQAREDAKRANELIRSARESAASALVWQKKAGQEAADAFQKAYEQQAADAAEQDRFEKMTDAQKADYLEQQAKQLESKSQSDLARAKELAFTDIDAANEMAQNALDEAQRARDLLDEAERLREQAKADAPPILLDLNQTESAAQAAADYQAMYDVAYRAASEKAGVTFIQNNTSPESLSAVDIYRNTNNQITYAAEKIGSAA